MKKTLLSMAIAIIGCYANAQNTFPGTGNAGIGTLSPSSALQIVGGGSTVGTNAVINNTDGALSIGNTSNSYTPNSNWVPGSTLLLNAGGYSTIGFHHAGVRVDFIRAGYGTIQLGYDGGWGMANIGFPNGIWNSTGNVGIGTVSPGASLDISGSSNGMTLLKTGSGNYSNAFFYAIDTQPGGTNTPRKVMQLGAGGTGGYSYGQQWYVSLGKNGGATGNGTDRYTNQLIFTTSTEADGYSATSDIMTLLGSGNVGIGTTSPFARLHIQNDTNTGTIAIGHNTYPGLITSSAATGEFRIDNRSSAAAGYISFYPNGQSTTVGSEAMRISTSGNLLIGKTSQTNTNYKLDINGSTRASEVVVNTTGADFVFEPDYKLLKLSENKELYRSEPPPAANTFGATNAEGRNECRRA